MHVLSAALSGAAFTPHVIIPGVPTAGDNFNIICRLDGVVERLAMNPALSVTLTFIATQGGASVDTSQNESIYFRPRTFNPGMTDDVGDYRCRAIVDVTFDIVFISPNVLGVLRMQSNMNCTD